jgi:hypothetical protein
MAATFRAAFALSWRASSEWWMTKQNRMIFEPCGRLDAPTAKEMVSGTKEAVRRSHC